MGSSASYDFWKPYSESGEKTESDVHKIPISKIFSWNGLHPSLHPYCKNKVTVQQNKNYIYCYFDRIHF